MKPIECINPFPTFLLRLVVIARDIWEMSSSASSEFTLHLFDCIVTMHHTTFIFVINYCVTRNFTTTFLDIKDIRITCFFPEHSDHFLTLAAFI